MKMLIIVEGGVVQEIVTDGAPEIYLLDRDDMMANAEIALKRFNSGYPAMIKDKRIGDRITMARMEIEQEQGIQNLQIGASA